MLRRVRSECLDRVRWLSRGGSGIALPLALLCLVAVSLLLSTALITSSTEVTLSGAHQDGTRSIYLAETAIEQFVAERAGTSSVPQLAGGTYTRAVEPGSEFRITAAELGRVRVRLPDGRLQRRETVALLAQPSSGRGRSTGALLTVHREAWAPGSGLNAGLMAGPEVVALPGGPFTLSGADTSSCAGSVVPGLALAQGTQAGDLREEMVVGGVRHDPVARHEYGRFALDGRSPEELAGLAEIRWGDLPGGRPISSTRFTASGANSASGGLNWGCPIGAGGGCLSDPDTAFLPVVAIRPPAGKVVTLNGTGQGFLLLLGDAELDAGFLFRGVVVAVGDVTIHGGARVLGALVALGDTTLDRASDRDGDDDEARIAAGAEIRFDRCGIERASAALGDRLLDQAPQQFVSRTFGWFEVLR